MVIYRVDYERKRINEQITVAKHTPMLESHDRFARQNRFGLRPAFPPASPRSRINAFQ